MQHAVILSDKKLTKYLIKHKASLDGTLSTAIMNKKPFETQRYLLDLGARDPQREALSMAIQFRQFQKFKILLRNHSLYDPATSTDALHLAATVGNYEVIHHLLDSGLSVDAMDSEGVTPLTSVCSSSRVNHGIITLLLNRGANVNARVQTPRAGSKFTKGDTPREQPRARAIELANER